MPRVLAAARALWCAAILFGPAGADAAQAQTPAPAAAPQNAELAEAVRLIEESDALARRGKFDDALPPAGRAVALRERVLGPDHVLVGDALGNVAALLYAKRKHKEAEVVLRRQLAIYEKAPAGEAGRAAAPLHLYLCVLHDAKRWDEQTALKQRIFRLENGFDVPARGARDASSPAGEVLPGRAIYKPAPRYPPEARQRRVTGAVLMKVAVDETGATTEVTALCGPRELRASAVRAASQNRYEPFSVGGRPVAVKGFITYHFTIQ
jgi:TonB family protein